MFNMVEEHASIKAFRHLIADSVDEFVNASRGFGEPLTAMATMVKQAFERELQFILAGVCSPQPNDVTFNRITEPLCGAIQEIQAFRDRNRHVDEYFNHLSTVSESIVALSWISVRPAPAQFVRDMRDAGDYFGNRVLATNKGHLRHSNWISKWNDVLKQLEQYVRDFHLTGFSWNCSTMSIRSAPPGPPGPPPPPPPGPYKLEMAGGDDRLALLNELNQGIGITRMLRPVRRDQESSASVQTQHVPVAATSRTQAAAPVYAPKLLLDGRKWRVEHQKNANLDIPNEDMSQSLAMFKCIDSGVKVLNKMNGVTIDNCKKTSVVLNGIISSVEVIRCERVKIHCSGHVPLISLDSSDSVQIFLTDKSLDTEVIQSKTTSCNVCIMKPDGDYVELPLPEQIRTVIVDGSMKSSVVEKY